MGTTSAASVKTMSPKKPSRIKRVASKLKLGANVGRDEGTLTHSAYHHPHEKMRAETDELAMRGGLYFPFKHEWRPDGLWS